MVPWVHEPDGTYSAQIVADLHPTVHLVVEGLGEDSWDWSVWSDGSHIQQSYGLADTAEQAKAQAEAAFGIMKIELSRRSIG